MARFALALAILTLYIYAFMDLAQADKREVRLIPKWLWAVVMIVVLILGPVLWLVVGRPRVQFPPSGGGGGGGSGPGGRGPRPRGPVAPDDDPEFLKRLDEQSWSSRMDRLRKERDAGGGPPPAGEGPSAASDGSDVGGA